MSMSTALIANIGLDVAAIVPIALLTRWAVRADRSDAHALRRRAWRAGTERGWVVTPQGRIQLVADQPPA
jgi:hypothetical protein